MKSTSSSRMSSPCPRNSGSCSWLRYHGSGGWTGGESRTHRSAPPSPRCGRHTSVTQRANKDESKRRRSRHPTAGGAVAAHISLAGEPELSGLVLRSELLQEARHSPSTEVVVANPGRRDRDASHLVVHAADVLLELGRRVGIHRSSRGS